jgi:hypothetical protein
MTLPEFSQPHHVEAERSRMVLIKAMSPARKLEIATQLYWAARDLKSAGVRRIHPDWTNEQVDLAVRDIFMHARP